MNKNRERDIAILIEDRCTRREAEKYLDRGTVIHENPEEYIQSLKDCECYNGETLEQIRNRGKSDVNMIEYEGHEYLIEYVL